MVSEMDAGPILGPLWQGSLWLQLHAIVPEEPEPEELENVASSGS